MKKILIFIVLMPTFTLTAQDIHFSQFYLNPIHLNPALVGVIDEDLRVSAIYRNQWQPVLKGAAYNTFSAAADARLAVGQKGNFFGFGINLFKDKAGTAAFTQQQGNLALSFAHKLLSYDRQGKYGMYLSGGATIGLGQWSADGTAVSFTSQYRPNGSLDPLLPPPTAGMAGWQAQFMDIGVGAMWFATFDNHASAYFGGAAYHLNKPLVSFFGEQNARLKPRFTIHGGGEIPITSDFSLIPNAVILLQNKFLEINSGLSGRFYFEENAESGKYFSVGAWYRLSQKNREGVLSDAAILALQLGLKNVTFGFSYDINISPLARSNATNNALELSVVYRFETGWNKEGVVCPRW